MSDREILAKAINKAIDGGWSWDIPLVDNNMWESASEVQKISVAERALVHGAYKLFIFNHDFAKALWGEMTEYLPKDYAGPHVGNTLFDSRHDVVAADGWQYHLQQMVVADDPIKYLGSGLADVASEAAS